MLNDEYRDLFYDILINQPNYISVFYKRKSDGRMRKIIAPHADYLKVQNVFLEYMESHNLFPISESAYGWVKGRNREECAAVHKGQKYILEMDIKSFFDNITDAHLRKLFVSNNIKEILGIPFEEFIQFITIPTGLEGYTSRVTAQGFKTSAYLANCVRYDIDKDLEALCEWNNWKFSSYGDNLFISGHQIPWAITRRIGAFIERDGFHPNYKKTRITPYWRRQNILSITVNQKVRIPRDYTKDIIRELVRRINERIPMDASLRGKINLLTINENPRDLKYIKRLENKLSEVLNEQAA